MNRVFITLSFLMGVVVLTSNYLVQFPINYFGLNEILTYGAFSYPIAFLITDITNRFYGKIIAKKGNKKEGILIDKNAEEYPFTLWDDQMRGIAIGTQIQFSNAYYSYDLRQIRSLNITSKNDIRIISG